MEDFLVYNKLQLHWSVCTQILVYMPICILSTQQWRGNLLQLCLLISSTLHLLRLLLKPTLFTLETQTTVNKFQQTLNRKANQLEESSVRYSASGEAFG